jgi:hypothetical protein
MTEMFRKFKACEEKHERVALSPQAFSSSSTGGQTHCAARIERKLPRKAGFVELEPGALFER